MIDSINAQLALGKGIDEILESYLPRSYQRYFSGFIQILPLEYALENCEVFIRSKKENEQFWIKQVIPSLMLLIGCFIGLIIFKNYGIDMMKSMASSFNQEIQWLDSMDVALSLAIALFILLVFMTFAVCISLWIPSLMILITRSLSSLVKQNILCLMISANFAVYLNCCLNAGIATVDSMHLLQKMNDHCVVYAARLIEKRCKKGIRFDQAIQISLLDENLIRFIQLSSYVGSVSTSLTSYAQFSREKVESRIKNYGRWLTLICYVTIGSLIICIYQVLLLPMNIIANL